MVVNTVDDVTRYIFSLSDAELLMFHSIGGTVPRQMRLRLIRLLAKVYSELHAVTPPPKERHSGPPITFPKRSSYEKRHDKKRRLARRPRLRFAA